MDALLSTFRKGVSLWFMSTLLSAACNAVTKKYKWDVNKFKLSKSFNCHHCYPYSVTACKLIDNLSGRTEHFGHSRSLTVNSVHLHLAQREVFSFRSSMSDPDDTAGDSWSTLDGFCRSFLPRHTNINQCGTRLCHSGIRYHCLNYKIIKKCEVYKNEIDALYQLLFSSGVFLFVFSRV